MSGDKQQILETITTVSKLITLSFKPIGTKIAFRDHALVFCDPKSDSYLKTSINQSIDRFWHGDSREDLFVLNHVIINFIKWYLQPYQSQNQEIYQDLIEMAKYLCVGLKRLQRTYKKGNVTIVLQCYINVINNVIDGKFHDSMLYTSDVDNNVTASEELDSNTDEVEGGNMEYSTFFDTNKIKTFWSEKDIKGICEQFKNCFRKPYVLPTGSINHRNPDNRRMSYQDQMAFQDDDSEIFDDAESVQTEEFDKKYPIPRSQKNPQVEGILVGIDRTLLNMDKKFAGLISKSIKGVK